MAIKIDIIAPTIEQGSSALTMVRWMKAVGEPVMQNEPLAEVKGATVKAYIHAPQEGTLSSVLVGPGLNILSGALLGTIAMIDKKNIDWNNFDQVTEILEDFAEKSKEGKSLKDANEALGQLLGVADKEVFTRMNVEQQNKFLQNVVDQHSSGGLSSAQVAQKLLEGLQLRTPQLAPATPSPAFGISTPTPGGNSANRQQQQNWQQPPQLPPTDQDKS